MGVESEASIWQQRGKAYPQGLQLSIRP